MAWPTALRPRQAEDGCGVRVGLENVISLSAGCLSTGRSRTLTWVHLLAIRRVFRPATCSAAKEQLAGLPLLPLFCVCPSGSGLLSPLRSSILEPASAIVFGSDPLYPAMCWSNKHSWRFRHVGDDPRWRLQLSTRPGNSLPPVSQQVMPHPHCRAVFWQGHATALPCLPGNGGRCYVLRVTLFVYYGVILYIHSAACGRVYVGECMWES